MTKMDGKMYGFVPGEQVWVRGRDGGTYLEAVIAPLERQVAYQAKANWQQHTVVIMRRATGVVGKPISVGYLLHDTAAVRAFVTADKAERAAHVLATRFCAREGLVWGGKQCQASRQWQTWHEAWAVRTRTQEALRTQIMSAKS